MGLLEFGLAGFTKQVVGSRSYTKAATAVSSFTRARFRIRLVL